MSVHKIVHITWSLNFGGIETMLVNIANIQAQQGLDVTVVVVDDNIDPTLISSLDKKIKIICLKRRVGQMSWSFIRSLNKTLESLKPDALHVHMSNIFVLLNRRLRKMSTFTLHGLPRGDKRHFPLIGGLFPVLNYTPISNVLLVDKMSKVASISRSVHDALKSQFGVESDVIPNGIDTSKFEKRAPGDISNGQFKLVQLSRLFIKEKGQDVLLKALTKLPPHFTLDLIGDGPDKDLLKSLVNELSIADRVNFLGAKPQSYVKSALKSYDLFIQPSRKEGFGLTVAEAMATGVPVLVSSGQGPAEVTCDEIYGYVFENGNHDDLAQKILSISHDYKAAITKAEVGHQHVIDNYDIHVTVDRYNQLYNR